MAAFGGNSEPGTGTLVQSTEYELFWGSDRGKGMVLEQNGNYSGAIADLGNTNFTRVIRAGLLVGKITSSGLLLEWDAEATDGSQNIFGVVPQEFRATDFDATNKASVLQVVVRAPLKVATLLMVDQAATGTEALDGGDFEYIARRQLHALGCILDDDPQGHKAGVGDRLLVKATSYTVTADDNGSTFTTRGAGVAVTFTLPTTIQRGLEYTFINEADQNMIVTGAANVMVTFNDLTATSVAYQTATELIGGIFKITVNDDGSKWVAHIIAEETQTVTVV